MLRPALMTSVLAASVALATPAVAGGDAYTVHQAPARSGWDRPGDAPAPRSVRRHHRAGPALVQGSPVRPVSYGETDGAIYHAWLPRNANLPIYNIPPPYFPEP